MDKIKLEYHLVNVARYLTKDEMNYKQSATTAIFYDFFKKRCKRFEYL